MTVMTSPTFDSLTDHWLDANDLDHVLNLDFTGWSVRVRANSKELIDELAFYYKDFPADPNRAEAEPDCEILAVEDAAPDIEALGLELTDKDREPGKKLKEAYQNFDGGRAVYKKLTGMLFLFGGGLNLAVGPCLENPNQVINFVNNRYIEYSLNLGCMLFHSSGVTRTGANGSQTGLAFAGFAGMGKSTLALHIMEKADDIVFVSNDRLMVRRADRGMVMHGVAKMPRINPGTVLANPALEPIIPEEDRKKFLALPTDELWNLEHKYDGFIDQCFGADRFVLAAPMTGLVLLNWKRDAGEFKWSKVNVAERPDLMPAFMKETGLFYDRRLGRWHEDPSEDLYIELLQGTPVFEFTGGIDFHAAAEVCLDLLGEGC